MKTFEFDPEIGPLLRVGTVGNGIPVEVSLHAGIMGGYPDPVTVTLLNDYRLEFPPGWPQRLPGTSGATLSVIPAWSVVPLPVPEAIALWRLGAAIDYVLTPGQRIYTKVDPATGINKPWIGGTSDDGKDLYFITPDAYET